MTQEHNELSTQDCHNLITPVKNVVYVYGDSHCVIFLNIETPKVKVEVSGYDGASITGLDDTKTSRLEYGKYIINIIEKEPASYYHLLKLGQVDLEFIMYHKIYIKNEIFTFNEYCDNLIDKYRIFIKKLLDKNKNIIISTINLPAYSDDVDIKNYIQNIISGDSNILQITPEQYNHIDPILRDFSLKQFNLNFIHFNNLLRNLASELNLKLFDTTDIFADNYTNILHDKYRNGNHHYKGYYNSVDSDAKQINSNAFLLFFDNLMS